MALALSRMNVSPTIKIWCQIIYLSPWIIEINLVLRMSNKLGLVESSWSYPLVDTFWFLVTTLILPQILEFNSGSYFRSYFLLFNFHHFCPWDSDWGLSALLTIDRDHSGLCHRLQAFNKFILVVSDLFTEWGFSSLLLGHKQRDRTRPPYSTQIEYSNNVNTNSDIIGPFRPNPTIKTSSFSSM